MSPPHEFTSPELIRHLVSLSTRSFEGTVVFPPADGRAEVVLRFRDGTIVDLHDAAPPTLLTRALVGAEELRERDRRRLLRAAESAGRDPGELLLEQQLLPPEVVSTRILEGVVDLFCRLLSPERSTCVTTPGPWPADDPGLARAVQLTLTVEDMLLDAGRCLDAWQPVATALPCLKDVFYATPQTFGLIEEADRFPVEVALISLLDGERDLLEVIEQAEIPPFGALDVLLRLYTEGFIALINPVQLFQQGCELEREGAYTRACRRFERAEERGLDDFDLGYKLAEVYEHLGRTAEAVAHYLEFSEKCVAQFRFEDTIRACARIIEIDPENLAIQDRYISLLSKYGKTDEALAQGLALARKLCERGAEDRARATLDQILEIGDGNEEVLRLHMDVCQRCGDEEGAARARRRLGDLFHQREESEKALELYQNLFVTGEDTPEVRSRLAELHLRAGNGEKAREHLAALRDRRGWSPRSASPEALEFFRRLLEVEPRLASVTGWLVEEARSRGDREETARMLEAHRDRLLEEGRLEEARVASESLVSLRPMDIAAARTLARLEMECGEHARAAMFLEKVARQLQEKKASDEEIGEILRELVAADRLSLRGRRLWLTNEAIGESDPARPQILLETGLLEVIAGEPAAGIERLAEAETALGEGQSWTASLVPHAALIAGRLASLRGDQAGALAALHRCARLSLESEDAALLGHAVEALEELTPGDPEVAHFRAQLEDLQSRTGGGPRRPRQVVQASLTGITAKLRSVKTGAPATATSETSETTEDAATPTSPSEPKPGAPPAPTTRTVQISGPAAALRALRGNDGVKDPAQSAPPAIEPSAEPSAADTSSSPARAESAAPSEHPAPRQARAGGPAAALRALREGTSPAPPRPPSSSPPSPPSPAGDAAKSAGVAAVKHPTPAPVEVTGPAAALRALRAEGDDVPRGPVAGSAEELSSSTPESVESTDAVEHPAPRPTKVAGPADALRALREQSEPSAAGDPPESEPPAAESTPSAGSAGGGDASREEDDPAPAGAPSGGALASPGEDAEEENERETQGESSPA